MCLENFDADFQSKIETSPQKLFQLSFHCRQQTWFFFKKMIQNSLSDIQVCMYDLALCNEVFECCYMQSEIFLLKSSIESLRIKTDNDSPFAFLNDSCLLTPTVCWSTNTRIPSWTSLSIISFTLEVSKNELGDTAMPHKGLLHISKGPRSLLRDSQNFHYLERNLLFFTEINPSLREVSSPSRFVNPLWF